MKRYTITEGAYTTAGGTVVEGSSHGKICGKQIALEGDVVFCVACHSFGKIKCSGFRLAETWQEKLVALENDLCLCRCLISPTLIANQKQRAQSVGPDASEHVVNMDAIGQGASRTGTGAISHDLYFQLIDDVSSLPLVHWPYSIEVNGTVVTQGESDEEGFTDRVTAESAVEAVLRIHECAILPVNPEWDR
ncbi:hypothetical protein GTP23_19795 [Pseudoduganella sp. FT93W]|uniref:PAAR domain-containing protein n=1 Tax=Duganella fentianensis TaxID=2692177 RepID=A0A845I192_9BURK|nr:hypothetical protein [Duganella fentianensis]